MPRRNGSHMTRAFAELPPTAFFLSNARVPATVLDADGLTTAPDSHVLVACDIQGDACRIRAVTPAGRSGRNGAARLTLDGGMVLPRLLDAHTHIDKGHIFPRAPNPDGTIANARTTTLVDREANWSAEDV